MRDDLADLTEGTDLVAQTTGSVPQGLDSQESGNRALAIVGIVTIVLIVALLAIIFRSVIICLMPVVVVTLVSFVATGLIGWANEAFDLKADSSIETILVVVLYGIGTDYILFFLFRYRERLRLGEDTKTAVVHALERAGEAIASAGGAVIVAFLALLLSSLGIFKAIGPALAIAVAVTLVAALTLVPGRRHRAGPGALLALEEVARRAEGGAVRQGRRVARAPPGALRRSRRAPCSRSWPSSRSASTRRSTSTRACPTTSSRPRRCTTFQDHFAAGASEPIPVILVSDDGPLDQSRPRDLPHRPGGCRRRRAGLPRRTLRGRHGGAVQRRTRRGPRVGRRAQGRQGTGPRRGARRRTGGHRGVRRGHAVDLRRPPVGDGARLQGRLPGRGAGHHADPGAAAAQPGGPALPDGGGRPELRRHPRRDRHRLPVHRGRQRADLHAADLHLPVRDGARHRLQHLDDRAPA